MAKSITTNASKKANKSDAYLTKRALKRAISKGTRHTSDEAIQQRGHVVTVKNGWVIKVNRNGTEQRISRLPQTKKMTKIKLD